MIKRAGEPEALTLATGQPDAAFANFALEALWQFMFDEVQNLRGGAYFPEPINLDFSVRNPERDVASNGVVDKKNILWNIANGSLPRWNERGCKRPTVDKNAAPSWLVKAQ